MSDESKTPSELFLEKLYDLQAEIKETADTVQRIGGGLRFSIGSKRPKGFKLDENYVEAMANHLAEEMDNCVWDALVRLEQECDKLRELYESAIALDEMRSQMEAIQIQPRPMLPHVHTPECKHEAEGSDYTFPLAPVPHSGNEEDFRFSLLAEQAKALQRWSQKQQRPITARDVQRAPKLPQLKNFSADQIRELFRLLERKGFGSTNTVGYSFTYTPNLKTFNSKAELLRSHAN